LYSCKEKKNLYHSTYQNRQIYPLFQFRIPVYPFIKITEEVMDRKSRTSRSANLDDTNEEVSLWKQICVALAKLEHVQKDTANVVTGINHIHTAVNMEQGTQKQGFFLEQN
jgi:hypothetical protein